MITQTIAPQSSPGVSVRFATIGREGPGSAPTAGLFEDAADPLSAARGILCAVALSAIFWITLLTALR